MVGILGSELKRVFINRGFVIALGIGLLLCLLHALVSGLICFDSRMNFFGLPGGDSHPATVGGLSYPLIVGGPFSWAFTSIWYSYKGIPSLLLSCYFLLLPLLVCLPYVRSYRLERSGRSSNNLESSAKKYLHWGVRLFAIFIAAVLITVVPLILDLLITAFLIPSIVIPAAAGASFLESYDQWIDSFVSFQLPFFILWFTLLAVFAGLLALLGAAVIYRSKKVFIGLSASFIVFTLSFYSLNALRGTQLTLAMFTKPLQALPQLYGGEVFVRSTTLIVVFAVLVLVLFVFFLQVKRKNKLF